jgi:hypothetical protein
MARLSIRVVFAALTLCAPALVACNGEGAEEAPQATSMPPAVSQESSGGNPSLAVGTVQPRVGDMVAVEGEGWTGVGAVRFYLVTEEQAGTAGQEVEFGRAPGLGEAIPDAGGAVSFEFELSPGYQSPSGGSLVVSSGDRLYIVGTQDTEHGSRGTRAGPFVAW